MLLQDEEARKKVIITIAVGISIFLTVITFPMYLLTHPIEAFSTLIENQEQIQLISDFKNQYGDYSSSDNTDVDISGDYVENIVLRGITDEGWILINDPNSEKFSRKTWDINIIINESKGMWAFTAKDKINIDSNMIESK